MGRDMATVHVVIRMLLLLIWVMEYEVNVRFLRTYTQYTGAGHCETQW